jgi:hypothetical protein
LLHDLVLQILALLSGDAECTRKSVQVPGVKAPL